MGSAIFAEIFCAIIFPPLGVLIRFDCEDEFWICLLLTFVGYFPGLIYAIYVLTKSCTDTDAVVEIVEMVGSIPAPPSPSDPSYC